MLFFLENSTLPNAIWTKMLKMPLFHEEAKMILKTSEVAQENNFRSWFSSCECQMDLV